MNSKAIKTASAVVLSLQLTQEIERGQVSFTVSASRPGRDGQFQRTWSSPTASIRADQAEDLTRWVQTLAHNALVAWGGVQEVMPT